MQSKTTRQSDIIFHADDFAANEEISEHILDCRREGALTSFSVLPNSPQLDSCMKQLARFCEQAVPCRKPLHMSIHFNLAEGHCLADPSQVPMLVDERGMFAISFFKVLLFSFTGKRKELKRQIKTELQLQLERMLPYIDTLRIDSHQHYHMIPVVLKSILELVQELPQTKPGKEWLAADAGHRAQIAFIRVPAEPLIPFLKHPKLYMSYRPINLVKNIVLNGLNIMDHNLLRPYRDRSAVFFGILLSGKMDLERVRTLLPDFKQIAERRALPLEVLCHPGGVKQPDGLMDVKNKDCVAFYTSEGRSQEKEMLQSIEQGS